MPVSHIPYLLTGLKDIDRAFRIAIGDILGNVIPYTEGLLLERPTTACAGRLPCQDELLAQHSPILLAGLDYDGLWTRDSAINVWNGAGLLIDRLGRNTLITVLEEADGKVRIAGQYWDAIIWTIGAWWEYLFSDDRDFLRLALNATRNSLEFFESTEFDPKLNLFRGPACYGDGVAAYPDIYARTKRASSGILQWPAANSELVCRIGQGIPMHALSTNCVYYHTYVLAGRMAAELKVAPDPAWQPKARALRQAINRCFWMPHEGRYRYLLDPFGGCDHQEGLGHAFALLLGVADADQARTVLAHQHITPAGIPCVWPGFARYSTPDGKSYGRHSGTVWPHVQGFWAEAAARFGRIDLFAFELRKLAGHACRDRQFAEVYHPDTGEIYGGIQERGLEHPRFAWRSCSRQTWSASAYLRMVLMGLLGMSWEPEGVRFSPTLPDGFQDVHLRNLRYRDMLLDVAVQGRGRVVAQFALNGKPVDQPFIPASAQGAQVVQIRVAEA